MIRHLEPAERANAAAMATSILAQPACPCPPCTFVTGLARALSGALADLGVAERELADTRAALLPGYQAMGGANAAAMTTPELAAEVVHSRARWQAAAEAAFDERTSRA